MSSTLRNGTDLVTKTLKSLDWKTIVSGAGLAYIASWVLFFLITPLMQKIIGNWKVASALSYGVSWIAMLVFFQIYASVSKGQVSLSSSMSS